jgi:hypothetical protein
MIKKQRGCWIQGNEIVRTMTLLIIWEMITKGYRFLFVAWVLIHVK